MMKNLLDMGRGGLLCEEVITLFLMHIVIHPNLVFLPLYIVLYILYT